LYATLTSALAGGGQGRGPGAHERMDAQAWTTLLEVTLSAGCWLLTAICYPLSTVCYLLCADYIWCLLFAVCCPLSDA
jgi:hypothetical protein